MCVLDGFSCYPWFPFSECKGTKNNCGLRMFWPKSIHFNTSFLLHYCRKNRDGRERNLKTGGWREWLLVSLPWLKSFAVEDVRGLTGVSEGLFSETLFFASAHTSLLKKFDSSSSKSQERSERLTHLLQAIHGNAIDIPLVCRQRSIGITMRIHWYPDDISMLCQWEMIETSMRSQWFVSEIPLVCLWDSIENESLSDKESFIKFGRREYFSYLCNHFYQS